MSKYKNYYNTATNTKQVAKKKTKKDWTYWVVVFALAFTFIGSILGTIAFAKSCVKESKHSESTFNSVNFELDNNNNSSFSASAFNSAKNNSTYYNFASDNLFVPLSRVNASTNSYTQHINHFFNYNLSLDFKSKEGIYDIDRYEYNLNLINSSSPNDVYYGIYRVRTNTTEFVDMHTTMLPFNFYFSESYIPEIDNVSNFDYVEYYLRYGLSSTSLKYQCYIRFYLRDTSNNVRLLKEPISRVDFSSSLVDWSTEISRHGLISFSSTTQDINDFYFNTLKYYQNDFLSIEIGFLCCNVENTTNVLFDNRSYYTLDAIENNSDYQLGYNNGKIDGVREGIESGTEDGFERGKYVGEQIGYDKGLRDGLNQSNSNTFYSLIGAVIDVPINTLQSLLNFELLGFNLFNFLTALITLGLIIFVVRLFI